MFSNRCYYQPFNQFQVWKSFQKIVLNLLSINLAHDGRVVSEYHWLTGCSPVDRSGGSQNKNEIKTRRAFGGIKPSGRFFPDFNAAV